VRVAIIADVELQRSASFVLAVNAQMPSDALRARFPSQVKIGHESVSLNRILIISSSHS